MGFFDRFRGKPEAAASLTDDELREQLFAARGEVLIELCRAHRERIGKLFVVWAKVPIALRDDREALERYANGMIGVAQCFAVVFDDKQLLERLHGGVEQAANVLVQWQKGLKQARQGIDAGDYKRAIPHLEKMLSVTERLKGTGADELLPLTLEYLAEARFHSGDAKGAVEPLERAFALPLDDDGKRAVANSLHEVYRYLGDFARAAKVPGIDAATVARVAAGEPLVRVVIAIEDKQYEIDEAPIITTTGVQFALLRNRIALRGADLRTEDGQGLASNGRYEEALACFEAAAAIDRFEPHCRFSAALTLVHLERYAEAVERYAEVERLAPGWFHSRFDAWLATQLRDEKLPHAAFTTLIELEDGRLKPDDKRALAEQCIARWSLAAGELHRGRALLAMGRHDEAIEAFRRGIVTSPEPDLRTRLALELAVTTGDEAAFRKAQDPKGNLVAAAQARYLQRARASAKVVH